MTTKTVYRCPDCRSTDVERVIHVWENPNTNFATGEYSREPDEFWCNQCANEKPELSVQEETVPCTA